MAELHRILIRSLPSFGSIFNISVLVILALPAPYRFKEYDVPSRTFVSTLAVHEMAGVQVQVRVVVASSPAANSSSA